MASQQEEGPGNYETLTRSFEASFDDGPLQGEYQNLSDAYSDRNQERTYLDECFSGSFDDPSQYLDVHPTGDQSSHFASTTDTISRRPPMPIPNNSTANSTVPGGQPQLAIKLEDVLPYSDSDDDYDDIEYDSPPQSQTTVISETLNRQRTESDVIDIIGSLCLEGVFQGVSEETGPKVLPDSIRMTNNLVKRGNELDELSVMVTRNVEIVPDTPFDTNASTKRSFGGILKTKKKGSSVPRLRLRARSDMPPPDRPNSVNVNKIDRRPTSVTYYDNIVRPQPLPPCDQSLSVEEKKRYKVMESLLESEAAFLTSLNIAVEIYKKPLVQRLSEGNPILDREQLSKLFGPIKMIQGHHELFYAAISEETKDWSPTKEIGGVFLASFSRKEVVRHYCRYVNNYSNAMDTLDTNIKKKPRFLDFLKRQIIQSGTQLSLQALLLKPVQRFPQYLLFLQDLIKYTPSAHQDRLKLEMAQAQIERVADYLNEAKRSAEQLLIVQYLSNKIVKIPFKLVDSNEFLIRQDSIRWVTKKSDNTPVIKSRQLFLFNKILICCASKSKKGKPQGEDKALVFKWSCPIAQLEVIEPDYSNEQCLPLSLNQGSTTFSETFEELRNDLRKLNDDFQKLCKMETLVSSLNGIYEGINLSVVHTATRVVQRELERVRDQLRNIEPGRVDITILGRDSSKSRYRHILVFPSNNTKKNWLKSVHFATLRLSQHNKKPWIMEEEETGPSITDQDDNGDPSDIIDGDHDSIHGDGSISASGGGGDDVLPGMPCSVDTLPLVVDQIKLMGFNDDCTSVECATCVGTNRIWFSCTGSESCQIAVVRCLTPTPMLLETFNVDCKRILCMKAISTTRGQVEANASPTGTLLVWLGSSCGKLMLYDPVLKACIKEVKLKDSILCIECFKNRAFVGLANGRVIVYTRLKGGQWDLSSKVHHIPVDQLPIQCFCPVNNELWIGVNNRCVILNMESLKLEHSIRLTSVPGVSVKRLTASNNGVWMALSKGGTLTLYHQQTRQPIQEVDIKGSLISICSCANISDRFTCLSSVHITSLLLSSGYLWVGTNIGALLVYRIPYLHGLPMTTGKPLLASNGHTDAMRVLIEVQTVLDIPAARFDQFVLDEKERKIGMFKDEKEVTSDDVAGNTVNGVKATDDRDDEMNCSMKIDDSAMPIVSDIIKRLERSKRVSKFPSPLVGRKLPFPKINKKQSKKCTKTDTKDVQAPPEVLPRSQTSVPVGPEEQPHRDEVLPSQASVGQPKPSSALKDKPSPSQIEHASDTSSTSTSQGPAANPPITIDTPSDYETPSTSTTSLELEPDPIVYDQVPVEDDLESEPSDTAINPQRYEGEALISLGDGLYDDFKRSTVSIGIPGHRSSFVNKVEENNVFIFTGGRGLVDLATDDSSHQILSNVANLEIAASSNVYQIPK